jgi:hypothetical protein
MTTESGVEPATREGPASRDQSFLAMSPLSVYRSKRRLLRENQARLLGLVDGDAVFGRKVHE